MSGTSSQARSAEQGSRSGGSFVRESTTTGGAVSEEWINIPGPVLAEVAKQLSDASSDATPGVPKQLVEAVITYLSEDLGCDHSVNICMCGQIGLVRDLRMALAGYKTCPACWGDGFQWHKEVYDRVYAELCARHPDEDPSWYDDESLGNLPCATCEGKGEVQI